MGMFVSGRTPGGAWSSKYPSSTLLTILLSLVSALSFMACSSTRPFAPEEYREDLVRSALVSTPSPIYRDGRDLIQIVSVDGEPITFFEDKVIVAPGRHSFQIRLELKRPKGEETLVTRADTSLTFTVEGGHEYLIDADDDEQGLWVWASDLTDNTIVAGNPPASLPAQLPGPRYPKNRLPNSP